MASDAVRLAPKRVPPATVNPPSCVDAAPERTVAVHVGLSMTSRPPRNSMRSAVAVALAMRTWFCSEDSDRVDGLTILNTPRSMVGVVVDAVEYGTAVARALPVPTLPGEGAP